jgi:hypothetical protein
MEIDMPDPNDILHTIQMLCGDVAKSKTRLGYDGDLMRRVGMVVFGNIDVLRDAIQAPDGQSWRTALCAEAEKRGNLEAEVESLRAALDIARTALLNIERRSEEGRAELSKMFSCGPRLKN